MFNKVHKSQDSSPSQTRLRMTREWADHIIWISYLTLVIVTPLLFTTQNTELFEVPKMIFVYFAATIILFLTLVKFVLERKVIIPKSWPLGILIIFVAIQVVSTLTSIDKFTSVFGYPSRLNGGLLSQFAYLAIFACALINLDIDRVKKLLAASVITAFAVSLWGIPGHFGRDPTCLVLTGNLTADCWQKEFDPRVRIFSTLGQPNWLASYLVLILPLALAMSMASRKLQAKMFFVIVTLTLFWALILTNSRSGAVGGGVALVVLILLLGAKIVKINIKILASIALAFIVIALTFAPTLVLRVGEALKQKSPPGSQVSGQTPVIVAEPTESGQIRLIVWQGALEVFKKYPLLGSGPETFVYSYYLFRPLAHNQTSEWNFFYNKAHNEFLNYAANIGILGGLGYLVFLGSTIITFIKFSRKTNGYTLRAKREVSLETSNNSYDKFSLRSNNKPDDVLFAKAIISSVIGYHTTIFFGFSTVATQTLMFMLIACILVLANAQNLKTIKLNFLSPTHQKVAAISLIIAGLWTQVFIGRIYLADFYLSRAQNQEGLGQLVAYANANQIAPATNPFYLAEYSYSLALSAATIDDQEKALTLAQQTTETARRVQKTSPNNLITTRKIANAYFLISDFDPQYRQQTLSLGAKLPILAPTDPQSFLTLAQIQAGLDQKDEAIKTLDKALELKPDYEEARELTKQLTIDR